MDAAKKNIDESHERNETAAKLGLTATRPNAALDQLSRSMIGRGVLSTRFKEMVALAICIVTKREDSLTDHVRNAWQAGASRKEILEVIGIAMLMGGDRSIRYGAEAVSALEERDAA